MKVIQCLREIPAIKLIRFRATELFFVLFLCSFHFGYSLCQMDHCLWSQFSEQFKNAMVLRNDRAQGAKDKRDYNLSVLYGCVCVFV